MITVSVHAAVEYPHIAKCYAALLQEWKNGGPLSGWLGNEGEWEENARLSEKPPRTLAQCGRGGKAEKPEGL